MCSRLGLSLPGGGSTAVSADTWVPRGTSGCVTPVHPGEAQLLQLGGRTPLGAPVPAALLLQAPAGPWQPGPASPPALALPRTCGSRRWRSG